MASAVPIALLLLAAAAPAFAQTGLGLGGLAPDAAPSPEESFANIDVPTDLCTAEFCLTAAPEACGGECILTPLANQTTYCADECYAVWNGAEVGSCLAGQATGLYVQTQLAAIAKKCDATTLAARRRAAAQKKYNALFPCTARVNATTLLLLDTCPTGSNATRATECPSQCSTALEDIPSTCVDTFSGLSEDWAGTLELCVAGAPGAAPEVGSGLGGDSPGSGLIDTGVFAPADSPSDASAPQAGSYQAALAPLLACALAGGVTLALLTA